MKIALYGIKDNINLDSEINLVKIDDIEELKKNNDVKVLIANVKNIELLNSIAQLLIFKPNLIFISFIEKKDYQLIPKVLAAGAKTFFFPPFNKNFPRILSYLKEIINKNKEEYEPTESFLGIVGKSKKILEVFNIIKNVAPTDSTVLITGESGTGKELVAKAIHSLSKRKDKPFIPINCGAIPKDLIESELFGYKKGAFTGANTNKVGRFEAANNGTVFLDEIGELPLDMQVKLLRVLQENEIQPIGSNLPIKINVRIIAATNKNLEQLIEENKFREDLFYRLNVINIHLPPLRERKEDIDLLIDHYIKIFSEKHEKSDKIYGMAEETKFILKNYSWPGNIRELKNCIERLVVLKSEGIILPSDLPPKFFDLDDLEDNVSDKEFMNNLFQLSDEGVDLKSLIENIETSMIIQALEKAGGVKEKAAKLLGIKRTTLIEKMKRKNLM